MKKENYKILETIAKMLEEEKFGYDEIELNEHQKTNYAPVPYINVIITINDKEVKENGNKG